MKMKTKCVMLIRDNTQNAFRSFGLHRFRVSQHPQSISIDIIFIILIWEAFNGSGKTLYVSNKHRHF